MRHILLTFFALLGLALSPSAQANNFSEIPVLHEGRIKPLDSYARTTLKKLSGSQRNATNKLARILFDPANAAQDPLFKITDPLIKQRLHLPKNQKTFSLITLREKLPTIEPEIRELLENPPEALSAQQEALLDLYSNMQTVNDLLHSFSALLPLSIELPETYKNLENNYLALMPHQTAIQAQIQNIITQKGENPKTYTAEEKRFALLGYTLENIRQHKNNSRELRVIPTGQNQEHATLWQAIGSGYLTPQNAEHISYWHNVLTAYRTDENWHNIPHPTATSWRTKIELIYNATHPLTIILALYISALALCTKPHICAPILGGTALIHLLAMAARTIILDRPPVGTLYESVIFVALICAITAIIMRRTPMALATGAASAALLLAIAPTLLSTQDSMEMLVAVLNTNFWLTTHVLTITAGYAICIIAACIAHLALLPKLSEKLDKPVYRLSIIALLLTAVGTALGGIWADQSWGRFWGWDPKENGALLITLWIIWLHHGRIAGKLSDPAFYAGIAALNIVVACAWFGVNLLNIGLHSYGFTTGLASALGAFCAAEILLIGHLFWRQRHHA